MPSVELFDEMMNARRGDTREQYRRGVMQSAFPTHAEYASDEWDAEVSGYVRHIAAAVEADTDLTTAQRDEIIGDLFVLLSYNTCFDVGDIAAALGIERNEYV